MKLAFSKELTNYPCFTFTTGFPFSSRAVGLSLSHVNFLQLLRSLFLKYINYPFLYSVDYFSFKIYFNVVRASSQVFSFFVKILGFYSTQWDFN